MFRDFAKVDFFGRHYNGSAPLEFSPQVGRSPVLMVAIQGNSYSPMRYGTNPMQRMQVVIVEPEENADFASVGPMMVLRGGMPSSARTFPLLPEKVPLNPGRVQGEILRDEAGRLYERIGRHVRPLFGPASGMEGRVVDVEPNAYPKPPAHPPNGPVSENPEGMTGEETRNSASDSTQVSGQPPVSSPPSQARATYHTLCPEPGHWCVVRLGDFKTLLAAQLAHPERLRDTHQLPCYVQVYEVTTAQRLESLAGAALGDPRCGYQLHLLNDTVAYVLGLGALLRTRSRVPRNFPRETGLLLPGERVFRLQPAYDPTADQATPNATPKAEPTSQVKEPVITGAPAQPASTAEEHAPKRSIPERFVKPWEFRASREEVLYDMNVSAGWLSRVLCRLTGWFNNRREFRKWKALLVGKSVDEQIWAVRPPARGLLHAAIRDWARSALGLAGYDANTMLLEWEVFWRRKGV